MKIAMSKSVLSVAIEAITPEFRQYKTGIFNSTACGTHTDHATNVVGWGSSNGVDYWLMRNSWGAGWGDSGYMRIEIVDGAVICGIQTRPLYAID